MLNIWVQLISLLRQPYCILFRYQSITVQSKSSLGSKFTQYGAYCPSSAPSQIMQIILIFSPQLSVIIIVTSFHIQYFNLFSTSFSFCLHSGITPITHIPPYHKIIWQGGFCYVAINFNFPLINFLEKSQRNLFQQTCMMFPIEVVLNQTNVQLCSSQVDKGKCDI